MFDRKKKQIQELEKQLEQAIKNTESIKKHLKIYHQQDKCYWCAAVRSFELVDVSRIEPGIRKGIKATPISAETKEAHREHIDAATKRPLLDYDKMLKQWENKGIDEASYVPDNLPPIPTELKGGKMVSWSTKMPNPFYEPEPVPLWRPQ